MSFRSKVVGIYFMLPSGKSGGKPSKVTEENFNLLGPGMTLSNVKEILGSGEDEVSSSEPPAAVREEGRRFKVGTWFKWRGDNASIYIGMTQSGLALARVSVVAYVQGTVSKLKSESVEDMDRVFEKKGQPRR